MPKVYYQRRIEGFTIPAIIRNGDYHYIDMPIYEDGSLDCWERISLKELEEKLKTKWLVTEVPTGSHFSFLNAGYTILDARWIYTPQSFRDHIYACVKRMNPEMIGLYEESSLIKARWEKHHISYTASPTPFKIENDFGYEIADGESTKLFYKLVNGWHLTTLTVFPDETIILDIVPGKNFTVGEIEGMFAQELLKTDFEGENTIIIDGLGTMKVKTEWCVNSSDKMIEIQDTLTKISGGKSLHEVCIERYHQYLVNPEEFYRVRLKEAYEAVPEHERRFLGDMDSKDWDFKRIIYHSERKREV